ncbi:distal membrane-arm assembly complex protein 1 [Rattus rattus]|uniref:distal membrane-arm assembly complex protein 1 n=1 Tax=Rattus rattus TaxID=10117 RepID=UPI0013F39B29|nr:distal membrane-arm assembly complex protein 1 [Rattus rattus]
MGSSFSSNSEFPAQGSTAALTASSSNPPAKAAVSASSAQDPVLKNCWSCRVLSGCTLLGAGTYVYFVARRPLKQGFPPGPGTVVQMVTGISIACWGVIVLIDPKGKDHQDV